MRIKILGILTFVIGLAACQPDTTCRQSINIACGVILQGTAIDSVGEMTEFTSWDSVSVQGVENDSILYNNAYMVSRLLLPLHVDTNLTAYTILWHEDTDTLYIRHTNTMKFISMACGCAIYHVIDSAWYSGSRIDSVKIVNSTVEAVAQDNIRVYVTTL